MSKLLPVRHPNKDFFILDVSDANPKNDMASMEHPIFSLSIKPDMRELEYETGNGKRLVVVPSGRGLATIMDKDILLYCISKLVDMKNRGEQITPIVELSAHEVMVATNWRTNKTSYKRFEDALVRMRGTTIHTDIPTGDEINSEGEGIIKKYRIKRKAPDGTISQFGRLMKVEITLSDWIFRSVDSLEVLSINREYFRLRRPLERRLYEIARKHVGTKNKRWTIGIEKLQRKVGTYSKDKKIQANRLKKFRFNLKEIIRDGNIPDYGFMLDGDNVVMQRLVDITAIPDRTNFIKLRPDTLDKAQKIAAKIGTSLFELEREWNEWSKSKSEQLKSPDGAFIAFCQQKQGSSGAQRVLQAREQDNEARQLGLILPDMEETGKLEHGD